MDAPGTVLGIDIGGSKSRGLLMDPQGRSRKIVVGSANIASVGPDKAGRALDALAAEIDGTVVDAICAGAAGANSAEGCAALRELLSQRFPDARVEVVNDTHLLLAAAGLTEGAVVIAGTGSAGWARRADGQETRAGGWGYLLGDSGSGYALTRDAVRSALDDDDHGRQQSPLTARLLLACAVENTWQLLDRFYQQPERRFWAGLAGVVLELAERGDLPATGIVDRATRALADLVSTVTGRLGLTGPVILAGGLMVHQPWFAGQLSRLLTARGLADVHVLDREPVQGAADLARQSLHRDVTVAKLQEVS
jgi:glucosamine kinase